MLIKCLKIVDNFEKTINIIALDLSTDKGIDPLKFKLSLMNIFTINLQKSETCSPKN